MEIQKTSFLASLILTIISGSGVEKWLRRHLPTHTQRTKNRRQPVIKLPASAV
jgi:hypothetical protein